jgi:hypothetical protein
MKILVRDLLYLLTGVLSKTFLFDKVSFLLFNLDFLDHCIFADYWLHVYLPLIFGTPWTQCKESNQGKNYNRTSLLRKTLGIDIPYCPLLTIMAIAVDRKLFCCKEPSISRILFHKQLIYYYNISVKILFLGERGILPPPRYSFEWGIIWSPQSTLCWADWMWHQLLQTSQILSAPSCQFPLHQGPNLPGPDRSIEEVPTLLWGLCSDGAAS